MRGRNTVVVEGASDRGEAISPRVVKSDALDDAPRERRRTAGAAPLASLASLVGRLQVLAEEAFELGGRDQPLPPRVFTVLREGTTRRSMVEMLTPRASAACLRL